MAEPKVIKLCESQLLVESLALPAVALGNDRFFGKYTLDVSGLVAGTTLSAFIETNVAGQKWTVVAALEDMDADGVFAMITLGCQQWLRVRFELNGTDPVTVALTGISHQTYCENADLATLALPEAALANIPATVKAEGCLSATDEALSYLSAWHDMPLISWGQALRMHSANMAAYHIMRRRGFSVDADETIRLAYTDAIAWLKSGAKSDGSIKDSTPTAGAESAYVNSRPARGWELP